MSSCWTTQPSRIHALLYMCVQLVISHIMTDPCQVTCRNDLHASAARYGFLNLFSFSRTCFEVENNLAELQRAQGAAAFHRKSNKSFCRFGSVLFSNPLTSRLG